MKKNSNLTINLLNQEELQQLSTVVKETIAKPKVFSAAELWDIQRRSRTMVSRRSYAY
ncbi:MAG TPA: hypothetical protein PKC51_00785 [Ferruginibacter sp.]|nr:hypothetical protein [Ferruginibacter sp.]